MNDTDKIRAWFQGFAPMQVIEKGGPGSGNWGHAGRPGMRGGSIPKTSAMSLATGATAAIRQVIAKDLSKEIATTRTMDNGSLVIHSPYNAEFVQDLRDNIASSMKKWDGRSKTWTIHPSAADKAHVIAARHYHALDEKSGGSDNLKKIRRAHEVMRVQDDQKYLQKHEPQIEARIQELEYEVSRTSRRRKPDVLRRQALYTYALLDSRAKPEGLQRVQRLSLAKVRGLLEGTRRDE